MYSIYVYSDEKKKFLMVKATWRQKQKYLNCLICHEIRDSKKISNKCGDTNESIQPQEVNHSRHYKCVVKHQGTLGKANFLKVTWLSKPMRVQQVCLQSTHLNSSPHPSTSLVCTQFRPLSYLMFHVFGPHWLFFLCLYPEIQISWPYVSISLDKWGVCYMLFLIHLCFKPAG